MQQGACCFVGHRNVVVTEALRGQLYSIIENLIVNEGVDTFLFGSKSEFDSLCYECVTVLKQKYSHIKRVYVRAEFPEINESYKAYLLERYEQTYYPESVTRAGKSVYLKRNYEMIQKSDFCVFYYNENCLPNNRKSGTKAAMEYATKHNKNIVVLPDLVKNDIV